MVLFCKKELLAVFLLAAAPFPITLPGGTTVTTQALTALLPSHPLLIDVLPAPAPPPDTRPGLPRLPVPHRDIPGSHWLPDTGRNALPPARQAWMLAALARLTAGDRARPIVVYCMSHCLMSWNAASRIVQAGYTHVSWYPDGADGWAAAGGALAGVVPER